jgi:hypothetical protein
MTLAATPHSDIAAEFVRLKVDVIVTSAPANVVAAAHAPRAAMLLS